MKLATVLLFAASGWAQMLPMPSASGSVTASATCTPAAGYSHCATFSIDHTQVGGSTLTNYPLWTPATLGSSLIQNANCYDLIFTSDSAGTVKIPWQMESCTQSTGMIKAMVNIASVSPTSNTRYYCSFDNPSISTAQNTGSNAPAHVWDANFQAAYLLSEANGSAGYADSTVNANNGVHGGADPTAAPGELGGAQSFNGTSQHFNSNSPLALGSTWTVSFWAKWSSVAGYQYFLGNYSGGSGFYFTLYNSSALRTLIYDSAGNEGIAGNTTVSAGTWYLVHVVFRSGTSTSIYMNGVLDATSGVGGTSANSTAALGVGEDVGGSGNFMHGSLDHILASSADRTSWVVIDYAAQKPASTLLTITIP